VAHTQQTNEWRLLLLLLLEAPIESLVDVGDVFPRDDKSGWEAREDVVTPKEEGDDEEDEDDVEPLLLGIVKGVAGCGKRRVARTPLVSSLTATSSLTTPLPTSSPDEEEEEVCVVFVAGARISNTRESNPTKQGRRTLF
jgi:hypothetical protein